MPYTVEKFMRVYNDRTGDYVEVREDRDALELIEIQNSESKHCVHDDYRTGSPAA